VVDNSPSMGTLRQAKVADGLAGLVDRLKQERPGIDLRIGVTSTTDDGNCGGEHSVEYGGAFTTTSCGAHREDFTFDAAAAEPASGATPQDCPDSCPARWPTLDSGGASWLQISGDVTNLGQDVNAAQAIGCIARLGVRGCEFEEPLESMRKSMLRSVNAEFAEFGFFRWGTPQAVLLAADEDDCSLRAAGETILDPAGDRALWSDPSADAPTSATCFHAGVACVGDGEPWLRCDPQRIDARGEVTADKELMLDVEDYDSWIRADFDWRTFVTVIAGVAPGQPSDDVSIVYEASDDPAFATTAGCEDDSGFAYPPVRLRELAEHAIDAGSGGLHSICEDNLSGAFAELGDHLLEELAAPCGPPCTAIRSDLQPACYGVAQVVTIDTVQEVAIAPCDAKGAATEAACIRFRFDDLPEACVEQQAPFSWEVVHAADSRLVGAHVQLLCQRDVDCDGPYGC